MFTVQQDLIGNGIAEGEMAQQFAGMNYDPGLMRPYLDRSGRACVTVRTGRTKPVVGADGKFITNESTGQRLVEPIFEKQLIAHRMLKGLPTPMVGNAGLLPKDSWIRLDAIISRAARLRLRAWADLRAANTLGGFDGMSNPLLEWESVTDAGEAVVDMDGMTEGRNFAPRYIRQGMPLPITHADFWLSRRFLNVSQNRGTPADNIRAEMAGRRIAEVLEETTIGTREGVEYGDDPDSDYGYTSKVYGYLNHPDRILKTNMPNPTTATGVEIHAAMIASRELLFANKFFGPFIIYYSSDYDAYLDKLFSTTEVAAGTLRRQLLGIEGIQALRRLDYLSSDTHPFTLIWVDMSPENVEAVNGMELTTVQWESMGGMRLNFKVMCIQVPRIRSRLTGAPGTTTQKAGILQATIS